MLASRKVRLVCLTTVSTVPTICCSAVLSTDRTSSSKRDDAMVLIDAALDNSDCRSFSADAARQCRQLLQSGDRGHGWRLFGRIRSTNDRLVLQRQFRTGAHNRRMQHRAVHAALDNDVLTGRKPVGDARIPIRSPSPSSPELATNQTSRSGCSSKWRMVSASVNNPATPVLLSAMPGPWILLSSRRMVRPVSAKIRYHYALKR